MVDDAIFTKEEKLTLRDKAFRQLRDAIVSGRLKPGTRLIEQDLSSEMGMSRFPIREAMASLEQDGLITVEAYRGAFVSIITHKEVEEIYSIRELLECHALSLLMAMKPPKSLKALKQHIQGMRDKPVDALENFVQKDFEFHAMICELSDNETLYKVWKTLSAKLQLYINIELRHEDIEQTITNHIKLCDLIASGDFAVAVVELQNHIRRGRNSLCNLI